jgi:hypothetical protein
MDFLQINKFSQLHDGSKIIFCKTDFLIDEFNSIRKLENDVILITGNSDYPIDKSRFFNVPKNIKKWFGQNILYDDEILEPIPIGIENKLESSRKGHGVGYYDRVKLKEELLLNKIEKTPTKKIYSNFNIFTNFSHRSKVREISMKYDHIDWEEPNLSLDTFFNKILDYEMIVCPSGNGLDTHRLWEILYSNRIPITIKMGNYKIYNLYKTLPIIVLEDISELKDIDLINEKYVKIKKNNYNLDILNSEHWINLIKKCQ